VDFAFFGVYDPVLGKKITIFDHFWPFFDIFEFELVPAGASLWIGFTTAQQRLFRF